MYNTCTVTQKEAKMQEQMEQYLDAIKNDYAQWGGEAKVREEMTKEFQASVRAEAGRKYIKVIAGSSVHSFIVIEDNPKFGFKKGDILKAATWSTPATNFARGNLFALDTVKVRWTGA
jgi:hypothetical protein